MTDSHAGLPYPRRASAVFAVSSGSLMLMIDASIANVVLPTLASELALPDSQAVLVVTVYQLVLAMTLMPLAALGERIGQRRLYCAGLLLHSLGALLCFAAGGLAALVAARALQALGTAAAMSVAFGLIRTIYPARELGKGMAVNTIANAGGTALAPVVGGLVLSVLSWHWVFAAAVPFSALSLLFSRALPAAEPHTRPFDLRGAALCATTFGLLFSGFQLTTRGPSPWAALAVLALGAAAAWWFVRHSLRQPDPVLPIDLLARPVLALALLANFSAVVGSMLMLVYMPFRLQQDFGFAPAEVGGLLASYAVASVMIAPVSGYLSDRIPVRTLCTAGMALAALGLALVALLPAQPQGIDIVWRLWLCGGGFGMFFAPASRLIIGSSPGHRAASAGSMVTTTRMLGQAVGAMLMAVLLASGLGDSMVPVLCALALVMVAGVTTALNRAAGREGGIQAK